MARADRLNADLLNQALVHRNAGRLKEMERICRELLAATPDCADAWHLLGVAACDSGDGQQAEIYLSRAIELNSHNPNYFNSLGVTLIEMRQYRRAEAVLNRALRFSPSSTDLLCNLGRVMMLQERFAEALDRLQQVLDIAPNHGVCLANMALIFQSRGQNKNAADHYRRALQIDPKRPKWWTNLGAALLSTASYASAETCFQHALALAPNDPSAVNGLGVAYCALGKYKESAEVLSRYLQSSPGDREATAGLSIVYQHIADWEGLGRLLPRLAQQTEDTLRQGKVPAEQPLFNIGRTDDLQLNLAVASAWSKSIAARVYRTAQPFAHTRNQGGPSDRRLTIGYLSADFRGHAVAHQAIALFELHDREQFRICGFSLGPDAGDAYRRRIAAACDHFADLSGADTGRAAQAIYDQKVDILIDLMGHTHQNRLDICALRPAPVQISYLGFLASSGATFIDYLIGDDIVTPPQHAPYYSEKLIRLPHCYQIISPVPASRCSFTRRDVHLPEKAFVFCCFNQVYKIDSRVFQCWMEILKEVPEAVLWLYRSNDTAVKRLQSDALRHGISPDRLIFAEKMPLADHLSRLQLADLALDTPLYNGGATTANALTAGVPLVTTLGRHFVSRMSASHLETLGLGELVASDLHAYAQLAVSLAKSPLHLASIRRTLQAGLKGSPLLDTAGFVRSLERAYVRVWSMHCQGGPPEHAMALHERDAGITATACHPGGSTKSLPRREIAGEAIICREENP